MDIQIDQIQNKIYVIRGVQVMLDRYLAELYGVETRVLNQSVRRNLKRFPDDFMFKLTREENEALKSQIVTSKEGRGGKQKQPLVFTENGVAMLSAVLKSDRAIEVNIAIMRIFTKLRSYYALESRIERKIDNLEENVTHVFKVVFERLDNLEEVVINQKKRKKIGLNSKD
ncbi:MAG: DNA-binding protein [Halobacteriovoraceae bacterium]|nr:DNA-binding protein [Halobacteriovoraceae bacterium]|tara:strand:+ start:15139 stop:15651 length:513 start_codon:yes stop_codon:yes gene_type:complete